MTAISDYSTLKTGVGEYLRRDGGTTLDSQIDTFIDGFEAHVNRVMRVVQMEEETSLTTDSDGNTTLPSDFLAARSVRRVGSPNIELKPISVGGENNISPYDTAGVARFFSISGTTLRVTPIEAGTDLLTLTYFEKVPALSNDNTTNWLIDLAPDAYLYGTLWYAHDFLMELDKAQMRRQQAEAILDEIQSLDDRARYNNAGIVNTDVPIA